MRGPTNTPVRINHLRHFLRRRESIAQPTNLVECSSMSFPGSLLAQTIDSRFLYPRGKESPSNQREGSMSVAKIIEISCESPKSFEDAIQNGIARAAKTIHNIKGAWVKEQQVMIENNKVSMYRVDLKVTFVLD